MSGRESDENQTVQGVLEKAATAMFSKTNRNRW